MGNTQTTAPASLRSLDLLYSELKDLYILGETEDEILDLLNEIEQAEQELNKFFNN